MMTSCEREDVLTELQKDSYGSGQIYIYIPTFFRYFVIVVEINRAKRNGKIIRSPVVILVERKISE